MHDRFPPSPRIKLFAAKPTPLSNLFVPSLTSLSETKGFEFKPPCRRQPVAATVFVSESASPWSSYEETRGGSTSCSSWQCFASLWLIQAIIYIQTHMAKLIKLSCINHYYSYRWLLLNEVSNKNGNSIWKRRSSYELLSYDCDEGNSSSMSGIRRGCPFVSRNGNNCLLFSVQCLCMCFCTEDNTFKQVIVILVDWQFFHR